MTDDLPQDLRARADRGDPRGADAVLAAAMAGRSHTDRRRSRFVMAAVVVVVALAAVSIVALQAPDSEDGSQDAATPAIDESTTSEPRVTAQGASSLVRFDDCGALLAELRARALDHVGPSGLPGLGWNGLMGWNDFSRRGLLEQGGVPAAAPGATSTNTQEAGVDEPDLVESDGERLFIVRAGVLRVMDTASAAVTHTISLGVVNVTGAMLVDDTLLVLADEPLVAARSETVMVAVDVTGTPVVRERVTATGSLVDARVAEGRAHVVVRSSPTIAFTYASTGDPAASEAATEANRQRIKASTIDDWLPHWSVSEGGSTATPADRMVACDEVRHPKTFAGFEQTTLVTLDLDDLAASQTTAVTAASQMVYGSEESVYVATTPFAELVADRPGPGGTDVHRFALGEVPTYAASGRVDGFVAGQLGFSEHEGHLRVASTTYDGTSDTRVTVLVEREGELVTAGAVTGLGRGEDIKGVRFLGDVGYVVTFRQTDPLFVVDLRDPVTPRLAGALSVPGYSAYLHPVGGGLVLGVGFDGTDAGVLTGGAVSLFDLRDPAAPTRIGLHGLGPYSAPVLVDDGHHAFTWLEERRTAFVPTGRLESGTFRGSVEVLHVADGALASVGRIEPSGEGSTPQARLDRVVVVDDRVYSVAPEGVQVSDLDTLAPIAWVPLG